MERHLPASPSRSRYGRARPAGRDSMMDFAKQVQFNAFLKVNILK
jgi:hypothetical protein